MPDRRSSGPAGWGPKGRWQRRHGPAPSELIPKVVEEIEKEPRVTYDGVVAIVKGLKGEKA
jgi:hypothetical protein